MIHIYSRTSGRCQVQGVSKFVIVSVVSLCSAVIPVGDAVWRGCVRCGRA